MSSLWETGRSQSLPFHCLAPGLAHRNITDTVNVNWTNPTSIQWTCRAKLFGKRNKAEWDTTSLHSNTNLTRRESLETFHSNYLSSNLHIPPPNPHISPNSTAAKVLSMQWSIRNQVLLLELHPFCDSFPFPPSILLFQTTEGPSPAGISKSL